MISLLSFSRNIHLSDERMRSQNRICETLSIQKLIFNYQLICTTSSSRFSVSPLLLLYPLIRSTNFRTRRYVLLHLPSSSVHRDIPARLTPFAYRATTMITAIHRVQCTHVLRDTHAKFNLFVFGTPLESQLVTRNLNIVNFSCSEFLCSKMLYCSDQKIGDMTEET